MGTCLMWVYASKLIFIACSFEKTVLLLSQCEISSNVGAL